MNLPSKDQTIQGLVVAGKVFGLVGGLAAYNDLIPPAFLPYAVFVIALASTAKEATILVLNLLRGVNTNLTPSKPNV